MVLVSQEFIAAEQPAMARLSIQIDESEALEPNVDFTGEVSRDEGETWTAATLVLKATNGSVKFYEDNAIDISSQPSSTSMKWRFRSFDGKNMAVEGIALQWV